MSDTEEDEREEAEKVKEKDSKKKKSDVVEEKADVLISKIDELLAAFAPKSTVLDGDIDQLQKDFSDAVALEATANEKLQLIQDSYAQLGNVIKESIEKSTSEIPVVSQPTQADNSQMIELANVVANLSQKFDLMMAKLSEPKELTGPKVPERRSIQPQPFLPFANTVQQTKPMSIRDVVNKSVGLSE